MSDSDDGEHEDEEDSDAPGDTDPVRVDTDSGSPPGDDTDRPASDSALDTDLGPDTDPQPDTDSTGDTDPTSDTDSTGDTDLAPDTDPTADTDTLADTATPRDTDPPSLDSDTGGAVLASHPPEIAGVEITPWLFVFNDTMLSCSVASVSDQDGDLAAVNFGWRNLTSGVDLSAGRTQQLSTLTAQPGDIIGCTVTAVDSLGATAQASANVTLENRAPVVVGPSISAVTAGPTTTLACAATAADPDGSPVVTTYAWRNETRGADVGAGPSVALTSATASRGDMLRCSATATDGNLITTRSATLSIDVPTILGVWEPIPAGTFTMGCLNGRDEAGAACASRTPEIPVHDVTFTRGFWMTQTEVTQGMWTQLMGSAPSSFARCGSTCPVDEVNWWDAVTFANAASAADGLPACYTLTGCSGFPGANLGCGAATVNTPSGSPYDCQGYRLPTESEWEYAARGGESAPYAGSATLSDVGWYTQISGSTTHPACSKAANAFGLCDMSGNVWEWTWDRYGAYSASAQTDPAGPTSGSFRILRGGSWRYDPAYARVAYRYQFTLASRINFIGFRLVRTQP